MKLDKMNFFIIAGTSKAGTTSVFNYLTKHDEVICSQLKESRYFLDEQYPLKSKIRLNRNSIGDYFALYNAKDSMDKWHVEATPDYLHSKNTAHSLHRHLPSAKIVFILREPISRLMSWYRFSQAMNDLPSNLSFDEYVSLQLDHGQQYPYAFSHPAYCAMQQGRYSKYLKTYYDLFDRSSIFITYYEDLKSNPRDFMASICSFMKIDERVYDNFDFKVVNKGVKVKNPAMHKSYVDFKESMKGWLKNQSRLRRLFRGCRIMADSIYSKINYSEKQEFSVSDSTRQQLVEYYEPEIDALSEFADRLPNWPSLSSSRQA